MLSALLQKSGGSILLAYQRVASVISEITIFIMAQYIGPQLGIESLKFEGKSGFKDLKI